MSRAADILNYFASRANSSSADIREGARTAVGLAYDLFWAPVTVPKAVISIGLGLPPVRALVLTPLLLLHRSCTRGKLISFTLLDASGKVSYTQPVWAQWDYNVSSLLELLEKHLQLQNKEVWIESLGTKQKGIFQDSYTPLPLKSTVKGKSLCVCCLLNAGTKFALPYVTVAAMVEERPSAAAEVMLTAKAPLGLESSPDTSPDKPPGRSSKEYFSLPADASFGAKRLLLTSHPIPASLIDGSSDADSPTHSPMSDPERLRFSPFK
ncbi:g9862 [Coccomyxa viridis]|uniref:G9862 protein n=1 Tax=Coccomyxa viridis TaxID=1274662 RepID=A0ABP1G882_9CHLO